MILRSSISTTRALCQIVGGDFIAGLSNEFDRGLNLLVTVSLRIEVFLYLVL